MKLTANLIFSNRFVCFQKSLLPGKAISLSKEIAVYENTLKWQ
jgi:hypothetical protein